MIKLLKRRREIIAIIFLGTFLRFFRLTENLIFHGELGHNYLAIKDFIAQGRIPLLGPPTSHPWLSFGPLFYWLFAPILAAFSFSPVAGGYFFAAIGVLIIFLNYLVIGRLFDQKTAIISSFLIAVSPAFLSLAREARFFSLVAVVFYPFIYFFLRSLESKGKYLFWAGLSLGAMLNFHLSPLILFPTIFYLLWRQKSNVPTKRLLGGLLGLSIPNIPFLIANIQDRFQMLGSLVLWVPYRVAGFAGLYPKNTFSLYILGRNSSSFYEFFVRSFYPAGNLFTLIVFVFLLVAVLMYKKRDAHFKALLLFLAVGYLGIFIHGDPPYHYYLPLYSTPIILASKLVSNFLKEKRYFIPALFLLSLVVLDTSFYFSDKWFYLPQDEITADYVPYKLQLEVVGKIINEANGEPFELHRIGPHDDFEGEYAQNYKYLLWWKGNEPKEHADLSYTIVEDSQSGVSVNKNEKED